MQRHALRWLLCVAVIAALTACEDDPENTGDEDATVDAMDDGTTTTDATTTSEDASTTGEDGTTTSEDGTSDDATTVDATDTADTGPECTTSTDCTGDLGFCLNNLCVECGADTDCSGDTPLCDDTGACVADVCDFTFNNFDCTSPERPACIEGACGSFDMCVDDDANEPDDGPAAATDITPTSGDTNSITSKICNAPLSESDWFVFTSGAADHWTITVSYPENEDLQVDVLDADSNFIGRSWYGAQHTEKIELTFLPEGEYFIVVKRPPNLGGPPPFEDTATLEYTVDVERITGNTCEGATDCAAFFETQNYRGSCNTNTGACEFIDGQGAVALGEACDSGDDCASSTCTYGKAGVSNFEAALSAYTSDADTRAFCTSVCTSDNDCSNGQICTTLFDSNNYCVDPCQRSTECPIILTTPRRTNSAFKDLAFYNLTCTDAGACERVEPALTVQDQMIGSGPAVTIESVSSDGPGFITIQKDTIDINTIIGEMPIPSGESADVVVSLSETPAAGTRLYAMLRVDGGTVGTFESALDPPVTNSGGFPVAPFFDVLAPPAAAITVASPQAMELTTLLVIDSITALEDGFIVVHADSGGNPGAVIVATPIAAGSYTDFEVGLPFATTEGDVLHPMLHSDGNSNGTYEDAATDPPVVEGGNVVVTAVTMSVADGTPDIELTLTATTDADGLAFSFTGVRPSNASWSSKVIGSEAADQTLNLFSGWSYAVVNQAVGSHPFEIITGDVTQNSPAGDAIMLSQRSGVEGDFESDADVAWDETTVPGTAYFTMDIGLEAGACTDPGTDCLAYRCGVHTGTMRGHIVVTSEGP